MSIYTQRKWVKLFVTRNYGTSTITEVDNYNIDTFFDFKIAKSLIMLLKSNSRSISDSMTLSFPGEHNTYPNAVLMLGQRRRWWGNINSLAICTSDCRLGPFSWTMSSQMMH